MMHSEMTLLLLVLFLQEDPAKLVERLSSERVEERDEAERKLLGLGPSALPALEKAARDRDAEVAGRAARLVRILKNRETLSPRLRAAFPGIEERLEAGDDREWLRLFLESTRQENNQLVFRNLRKEDFLVLAPGAIRAARSDEERLTVAGVVSDRRLEGVALLTAPFLASESQDLWHRVPECLRMAKPEEVVPALEPALTHASKPVRWNAIRLLAAYKIRASVAPCARALKDKHIDVRRQALETLAELGFPEALPHVLPMLQEKDPEWIPGAAAKVLGRLGSKDAVPHLLPLLTHAHGYAREQAADSLVILIGAEALPRLLPLLGDPDPDCRRSALAAAAAFEGEKALPRIRPFLEDPAEELRSFALRLLAGKGDRESVPAIATLLKDAKPGVRRDALEALGLLGAKDRLPEILPFLTDPEVDLRYQAMATIGKLDAREAAPEILKLLKDPQDYVRRDAMELLVRWEVKEAAAGILQLMSHPDSLEDAVKALEKLKSWKALVPDLVPLLASEHEKVRRAAFGLLEKAPLDPVPPVLLHLLAHPLGDTRYHARQLLQNAKSLKVVPEARRLLRHADAGVRADAAWLLADLEEEAAVPDLLPLAKDEDPRVRAAALEGLASHGDRAVVPLLVAALKDSFAEVRLNALDGVLRFNAKEAAPSLPPLLGDPDSLVRERANRVFWSFQEAYDAKSLAPFLETEGAMVQGGVLRMLAQVGSAELAPRVLPFLKSDASWVRVAAASALSAWGVREARDEIRKLADDPDMHVRRSAFLALSDEKPRVLAAIRDPQLRDLAVGMAGRAKMEEAIPDLRRLMDEGDPEILPHVMGALADLGARDLVPQLLKMLGEEGTRHTAVNLLGRLGAREALPALVRMCDPDRHDGTLLEALGALKVTIADLEPHLRSDVSADRRRGVLILQRVRPPGAAGRIAPLAADPDPGVRMQVLGALGEFDDPSLLGAAAERLIADPDPQLRSFAMGFLMRSHGDAALPAVRRLLEDPAPSVRCEAIRRLSDAWTRDDLPRLTRFLRDEETACAAAEALGGIGVREAIPDVLSHLKEHKCREAAEALARLDAREAVPVLEKFLAEGSGSDRLSAALCRLGSAAGAPRLVASYHDCRFPLNALRSPSVWAKLRATRLPGPLKGSGREVLRRIGDAAGLSIEFPADDSREWKVEIAAGTPLLEAIEQTRWGHVVLESDRLRVLPDDAERRFWRAWWRAQQKR